MGRNLGVAIENPGGPWDRIAGDSHPMVMPDTRRPDRLSLCVALCCGLGLAACSDDTEPADTDPDSSSSAGSDAETTDDPPTTDPTEADSSSGTDASSSDATSSGSESSSEGAPACDDDAQCDDAQPCTEDRCVDGACASTDLDGVPAPESEQVAGDCTVVSCVAGAPSAGPDDADLPVDGDDCTDDVCTDGVPSNPSASLPMCVPEAICDDGLDDDLDGAADCLDADCDGIEGCEVGSELTCDDGFDNDGDELPDCLDPDCDGIAGCEVMLELTCDDGFDNDGDELVDCLDPECDGVGACQLGDEFACDDGFDNDGDGNVDCDDFDCIAEPVCTPSDEFQCNDGVDNDSDGLLDGAEPQCGWVNLAMPCAAGHAFGFSATDLPQAIPSVGSSMHESDIPVTLEATVAALAVRIDISHTYDSDLDIRLISPSFTIRELSTNNGVDGDNYSNTVFTDSGPGVIGSIGFDNPPFAGTYQPEQAFAPTLVGESTDGDWILSVNDEYNLDGGSFNTFQLGICTQ